MCPHCESKVRQEIERRRKRRESKKEGGKWENTESSNGRNRRDRSESVEGDVENR